MTDTFAGHRTIESNTGETFRIMYSYGDRTATGAALPPNHVLEITSLDKHGYKSAHRTLARRAGFSRKDPTELRRFNCHGHIVITTFWIKDREV